MCLRGPAPTPSVKNDRPMPIISPARPLLGLLPPKVVVAGDAHRLGEGARVVAGVVLPARRRGVRELLGLEQVLHPQLRPDPSAARTARQSTIRSTRYAASVMRNEHAYATPPGALFVYTARTLQCAAG